MALSLVQLNEQGRILHRYFTRWEFVSSHLHLQSTPSSYTYESEAHSTLSSIDHIVCPHRMLPRYAFAGLPGSLLHDMPPLSVFLGVLRISLISIYTPLIPFFYLLRHESLRNLFLLIGCQGGIPFLKQLAKSVSIISTVGLLLVNHVTLTTLPVKPTKILQFLSEASSENN